MAKKAVIINQVAKSLGDRLIKPNIVVYDSEKKIIVMTNSNIETYPGVGSFFQEFDTADELEEFVMENQLIE